MGYHLNRLDEPVFMAGPKLMRTELGIHLRLESCELTSSACLANVATSLGSSLPVNALMIVPSTA